MKKSQQCNLAAKATRKPIRLPKRAVRRSALPKEHQEARDLEKWIRKARRLPAIRKELVERIRAKIAADTYETKEKLDLALERMLRDLADA